MRYVCTGRVHPERANVQFERCEVKSDQWDAVVSCDASQVTVVLDVNPCDRPIAAFTAREIAVNRVSATNTYFRLALQDYLKAINDVRDCPTYCYRAIEAIKSTFGGKTESEQWDAMHSALGTDRSIIVDTVKQYADPTRHGNWMGAKEPTAGNRFEMLRLTRDVLIKYMDYAETSVDQ